MDISKLSNEDLIALHSKQYDKLSNEGLTYLHSQNSSAPQAPQPMAASQSLYNAAKRYNDTLPSIRTPDGKVNTDVSNDPSAKMGMEMGMGAALQPVNEAAMSPILNKIGGGLKKGGDILLQKAVGIKRYIPGLGETLADEGLIGTKGMMRGQVESGLEKRGQEIGELAKSVQSVNTQPIAERLGEQASKLVGPDGTILPDNIKAFHQYVDAAKNASQEGAITGEVAATRRSQYGKIARDAGRYRDNPAQGLKAQLAGTQQSAYSNALKSAPGAPEGLAEADKAYGALAQADKVMSQPESLTAMGLANKAILPLAGAAGGAAISPDNRTAGALLGAGLSTPLAQSALGRALIGLGKASGTSAARKLSSYAPTALEEFLGRKNQSTEDR